MSTIAIKPQKGRKIRYPDSKEALPPEGAAVEDSPYWRRRLRRGDVVEVGGPRPKSPTSATLTCVVGDDIVAVDEGMLQQLVDENAHLRDRQSELRGELEQVRKELQAEIEKAEAALKEAQAAVVERDATIAELSAEIEAATAPPKPPEAAKSAAPKKASGKSAKKKG